MARPEVERPSNALQHDDLDALFEPDHGMDDIFDEIRRGAEGTTGDNTREPKEVNYGSTRPGDADEDDEKIKITKKRAPVAKLDDARLLSEAGISKLQRISKTRLKFRGKGHEFSDVAQLLRTYQLWLDDLYPRAKFSDGLAMIEKLGHSKRMQVRRKGWIDEGKPKEPFEDGDADLEEHLSATPEPRTENSASEIEVAGVPFARSSPDPGIDESERSDANRTGSRPSAAPPEHNDLDELDADDLDALLAEEAAELSNTNEITTKLGVHRPDTIEEHPFHDDEDAMREMEGMEELW